MFWRKSDLHDAASMSVNPFIQNPSGQMYFRIHNSLDFEQITWGICWILQNISTESGAIPTIEPIGSTSSKIFGQLSSQSGINKNYTNLTSVQVGFCHQVNYGTKFRRKEKNTLAFKVFWIRDCGPLMSLTSPCRHWSISTALIPGLWLGWGCCLPPQNRGSSMCLDDLRWQYCHEDSLRNEY